MSAVQQLTRVTIDMEASCPADGGCNGLAENLFDTLDGGRYDRCSVLTIPHDIDGWMVAHRTARKRVLRAQRHGYVFSVIDRHDHQDDVYAINTSLDERQGRPMSDGYRQPPAFSPLPTYPCVRHGIRTYGVLDRDDRLVAYLWMYRAGQLALVSSILGHADHLDQGIMYLLFAGALDQEIAAGPGYVVYNRHDSGTDGLRFFKERCGLTEHEVRWCR